jgi:hypothetical protein
MEPEGGPEDRIDFASLERLSAGAPPPREKQGSALTKAVAVLVPLVVLAAVPWILVTKFLKDSAAPEPTVSASPSAAPPASASPSPSVAAGKGTYEITGLEGASCLRIHSAPGTGTPVIDCLQAGIQVTSDGRSAEANGLPWLRVHDPIVKKDGWAAATYLRKVG